ncbi:hypothetical protein [Halomonas nitroreducens]|uniref:Uncharacterized protein n=1 Tax=Halomonas nitroreducens TaxID=447425 RepID=A0A3S0I5G9_9GAMM|nr:hypothetical protein [Halomonas nitroreducens]RTQ99135.1 hypothetical protein EKG36_17985 [Halomonas nitroreducens]
MRDDGGFNAFDHAERVKEGSAFRHSDRVSGDLPPEDDRPEEAPPFPHPHPHSPHPSDPHP